MTNVHIPQTQEEARGTLILSGHHISVLPGDNDVEVSRGAALIKNSQYRFPGWPTVAIPPGLSFLYVLPTGGTILVPTPPNNQEEVLNKLLVGVIDKPTLITHVTQSPFREEFGSWHDVAYRMFAMGPVISQGVVASKNAGTTSIGLSAGEIIKVDGQPIPIPANSAIQFIPIHRNASGGWVMGTPTSSVQTSKYDDGSGILVSMGAGQYRADMLYYSVYQNVFYLMTGQLQTSSFSDLHNIDGFPEFQTGTSDLFKIAMGLVPIARVYVRNTPSEITRIVDSRRVPGLYVLLGLSTPIEEEELELVKPVCARYNNLLAGVANAPVWEVSGVVPEVVMPKSGYIIATAAQVDQTITGGNVVVNLRKNGVQILDPALDLTLDPTNPTKRWAAVPAGNLNFQFNAGDTLGLIASTAAGLLPVPLNFVGHIYVKFD